MRYDGAARLLRLCQMIGASHQGVSLQEIAERFSVSRRTAERMRDAALDLMEEVEERRDHLGHKRWRARMGAALPELAVSAEDLGALKSAANVLSATGREDEAGRLTALADRIMASQKEAVRRRIEPDLELILESEGLAARPGPRVSVASQTVGALRQAILAGERVAITYRGRLDQRPRRRVIEPYGFLHGTRPFLVARIKGRTNFLHYRLQGVSEVAPTGEFFARDQGFTLESHARRCFGTFLEPPFDVVWRFAPSAAKDAAEYVFHPDQQTTRDAEGGLIVRFRAGGALEMAWHLMTWGDAVEVIEPADLFERARISRARFA